MSRSLELREASCSSALTSGRVSRRLSNCEGGLWARGEGEPKLKAEERVRGFEKATKSGVSLRYLGLRVALPEPGLNAGRMVFQ